MNKLISVSTQPRTNETDFSMAVLRRRTKTDGANDGMGKIAGFNSNLSALDAETKVPGPQIFEPSSVGSSRFSVRLSKSLTTAHTSHGSVVSRRSSLDESIRTYTQSTLYKFSTLESPTDQFKLNTFTLTCDTRVEASDQQPAKHEFTSANAFKETLQPHLDTILELGSPQKRARAIAHLNKTIVQSFTRHAKDERPLAHALFHLYQAGLLTHESWQLTIDQHVRKSSNLDDYRRNMNECFERLKTEIATVKPEDAGFAPFVHQLMTHNLRFLDVKKDLSSSAIQADIAHSRKLDALWELLSQPLEAVSDADTIQLALHAIHLFFEFKVDSLELFDLNQNYGRLYSILNDTRFEGLSPKVKEGLMNTHLGNTCNFLLFNSIQVKGRHMPEVLPAHETASIKRQGHLDVHLFKEQLNRSLQLLFKFNSYHVFFAELYKIYKAKSQEKSLGDASLFYDATFIVSDFIRQHLEPIYGSFSDRQDQEDVLTHQKHGFFMQANLDALMRHKLFEGYDQSEFDKSIRVLLRHLHNLNGISEDEKIFFGLKSQNTSDAQQFPRTFKEVQALVKNKSKFRACKQCLESLESRFPHLKPTTTILKTNLNYVREQNKQKSARGGFVHLSSAQKKLLDPDVVKIIRNLFVKNIGLVGPDSSPTHPVFPIKGMYLKWTSLKTEEDGIRYIPGYPGVTKMVRSLDTLLFGTETTPSNLLRVTVDGRPYAAEATIEVKGTGLDTVLTGNPRHRVDPSSFAKLLIHSVLCMFQDFKGDNIKEGPDGSITGIDYDFAFTDPVLTQRYGNRDYRFSAGRNILFFMDQMDEPIPLNVRLMMRQKSPELIVLEWLSELKHHNLTFEANLADLFAKEDFDLLQLPIKLGKGMIETLCAHIRIIQQTLANDCTGNELLRAVHPAIFIHKTKIQEKYPNPQEALAIMWSNSRKDDVNWDIPDAPREAPVASYEYLFGPNLDGIEDQDLREQILASTTDAASFMFDKVVPINQAEKDWLKDINYENLDPATQYAMLQRTFSICPPSMSIANSDSLTDSMLINFARTLHAKDKWVHTICIANCPNVTVAGLMALIKQAPSIRINYVPHEGFSDSDAALFTELGKFTDNLTYYESMDALRLIATFNQTLRLDNQAESQETQEKENLENFLFRLQLPAASLVRKELENNCQTIIQASKQVLGSVGHSMQIAKLAYAFFILGLKNFRENKHMLSALIDCVIELIEHSTDTPERQQMYLQVFKFARKAGVTFQNMDKLYRCFDGTTIELPIAGFSGLTDRVFQQVAARSPNAHYIYMAGNPNITDTSVHEFGAKFPSLVNLDISGCKRLTHEGIAHGLANCKMLTHLEIGGSFDAPMPFTDASLHALLNDKPQLSHLTLRYCSQLTHEGIVHLATHANHLKSIEIRYCSNVTEATCQALSEAGIKLIAHGDELNWES